MCNSCIILAIKQVDEGQISTVKDITKLTFQALDLRQSKSCIDVLPPLTNPTSYKGPTDKERVDLGT